MRQLARAKTPPSQVGRDDTALRRIERMSAAIEGFFTTLGGLADIVAALTIGVLGIRKPIVKADWNHLSRLGSTHLEPTGTPGRHLQDSVVHAIKQAADSPPSAWFSWSMSMRNALVHRGQLFQMWSVSHWQQPTDTRVFFRLPQNPDLTDVEAFVIGSGSIDDFLLPEDAEITIKRIRSNTFALLNSVIGELAAAWNKRKGNRNLITQPVEQWPKFFPKNRDLSPFAGFGGSVDPPEGEIHASPALYRRVKAAKLRDQERQIWVQLLSS
jgi:hypothetical protein